MTVNPNPLDLYYILCQSWTPALEIVLQQPVRKFCHWVLHGLWLNSRSEELILPFNVKDRLDNMEMKEVCNDENLARKLSVLQPYVAEVGAYYRYGGGQDGYILEVARKHGGLVMFQNHRIQQNLIQPQNRFKDMTAYLEKGADLVKDYNLGLYLQGFPLGRQYTKQEFHNAIAHGFTQRPRIKYRFDPRIMDDVIHEVHLCFDLNFNPIDCHIQDTRIGTFTYTECCDGVGTAIEQIDENDPEKHKPC